MDAPTGQAPNTTDISVLDEYTASSPFGGTCQLLRTVADPTTRFSAIRFLIASVVTANIDPSGGDSDPLLPLGTACCLSNIHGDDFDGRRDDYDRLFSQWHVLTGYLQQGVDRRQAFTAGDDRTENVESVCRTLDLVVAQYAKLGVEKQRQKDLLQLVMRVSTFGSTLVSQPCSFRFFWGHQDEGIVLFVSLVQESDEAGIRLGQLEELGECGYASEFGRHY